MAINSNTSYLQYWEDFSLLGKLIKKYAIALWISMAAIVIGCIITFFAFLIPSITLSSNSADDIYTLLIALGGILLFIFILIFSTGIYKLITHIQYLIQLKKVGEYTNDVDLQKTYTMELWALIISFLIWIILILGSIIIYIVISSIDDYSSETFISMYLLLILGFLFVIFIVVTSTVIFQILSTIALDRWGQGIKMANFQNRNAVDIAEGTSLMKFGRIITIAAAPIAIIIPMMGIIAGLIGMVLFQIGLMKTGKNMTEFFDEYGNYLSTQTVVDLKSSIGSVSQFLGPSTTNPNTYQNSNPNINPSENLTYMRNSSDGGATMKPHDSEFCVFCSTSIVDKNSKFCANCGRKLF